MKTLQEKEYNYSDVLLYKVRENNKNEKVILAIVDDEDQLAKYNFTGKPEDAPVAIIDYNEESERELIANMKRIKKCELVNGKAIVTYEDGEKRTFTGSNIETIREVLDKQEDYTKRQIIGEWDKLPEEKKEEQIKKNNSTWKKVLSGALAGVILTGGLYHGLKGLSKDNKTYSNELPSEDDKKTETSITQNDEEYKKYQEDGKKLHQETVNKNAYILKYQQVSDVKWDEVLAVEVVEFINGVYPKELEYMSEQNADARLTEILQAIQLLIAGNLNSETKADDMINLADYVSNIKEKAIINNAFVISRNVVSESIGEPVNGKIIESDDEINNFSREYTNAVDEFMHHEFETINKGDFITSSMGCRFTTSSIFHFMNGMIPQWSYITRESSETDKREYDLYLQYFQDDVEKDLYLPEPGKNGTVQYKCVYEDEKGRCKEKIYTEDEMLALAGISSEEEQRNLKIEANPNIHELGIYIQNKSALKRAQEEIMNLNNTIQVGDATLGITK